MNNVQTKNNTFTVPYLYYYYLIIIHYYQILNYSYVLTVGGRWSFFLFIDNEILRGFTQNPLLVTLFVPFGGRRIRIVSGRLNHRYYVGLNHLESSDFWGISLRRNLHHPMSRGRAFCLDVLQLLPHKLLVLLLSSISASQTLLPWQQVNLDTGGSSPRRLHSSNHNWTPFILVIVIAWGQGRLMMLKRLEGFDRWRFGWKAHRPPGITFLCRCCPLKNAGKWNMKT